MHKQLIAMDDYKQKSTRFYISFFLSVDAFVVFLLVQRELPILVLYYTSVGRGMREKKWITAVGINAVSFSSPSPAWWLVYRWFGAYTPS